MFDKKLKIVYSYTDPILGNVTKTKKMSESEFDTFKDGADVKILSINGEPYRK